MSTNGKNGTPRLPAQISEETVQRMLSVQEQKLALELKQAEISLREIDHNQKIADKSIQAQSEDRKDERAVEKSMHGQRLVFAGAMAVLLVCFVLTALWMNKDALVLDVIKVLIGFIGGWGGSIAWQVHRHRQREDHD